MISHEGPVTLAPRAAVIGGLDHIQGHTRDCWPQFLTMWGPHGAVKGWEKERAAK